MVQVRVQAGVSLLESYRRTPPVGLCELVWNAFDEDAKQVDIRFEYNGLGGIEAIVVSDNGNGMNLERAQTAFSRVGDSWKGMEGTKSLSGKRTVHGRHGRGRYAAFSLGNLVRWLSVSEKVEGGDLGTVQITGQRVSLDSFDISEMPTIDSQKGTVVTIVQVSPEAVKAFDEALELRSRILTEFALHLERYDDFDIIFMGNRVQPGEIIATRRDIELDMPEGLEGSATLTVIEWKLDNVRRCIYLCDADDRVVDEVDARIQSPGSEFTAYLKWEGFKESDPLGLEDDTETPSGQLIAVAREVLREHMGESSRRREAETLQRWRNEGVYPYKNDPKSPIERATRDTFNIVAMAASRAVDDSKSTQSKALALSLLKETFENDPESLLPILHDVAKLPKARIEELTELLKRTSLTQLIQVGRAVGDRLEFLSGLNTILFDRQIKRRLLERRQLHRILAHETWIFGEEWSLTGDDVRLTVVLEKFLAKLGQPVELANMKQVLREDGTDAIPDLVLGRRLETTANSFEHLVIELKRPKHKLDDGDVTQLRSYASAIVNDESFAQPNVKWDFWLVGNDTTRTVDELRAQNHLPYGVVQDSGSYRLVVKQWSELISDAEHRLKFVQSSLQYETSHDGGLAHLRERYAEFLPVEALQVQDGDHTESA